MSPKRDIINMPIQQTSHYILARTQMQSQHYLNSLLTHSSIANQTCTITASHHDYHVSELTVRHGSQTLFNFTRLVLIANSSLGQLECAQRITQAKQYSFDGISSQPRKAEISKQKLMSEKREESLVEELKNVYQNTKSVQLIRVDCPTGDDIYVSYSVAIDRWLISGQSQTTLYPLPPTLEASSKNQPAIENWEQLLAEVGEKVTLLKQTLAKYTICGKLNSQTKQIRWYSVNSTSKLESHCEDPFDAKQMLEKCGLVFTKIKTLSVLNNQDKIIRALENIVSNVRSDVSQNKSKVLGRCTVLLVSSFDKKVLTCFHVLTIEDVILAFMKELFLSSSTKQQKAILFKSYLQKLRQYKKCTLPFPTQHYLSTFQKSLEVIQLCKLSDRVEQKCMEIIKFTLYAELKKIDLQKFGESLPWNTTLLQQAGTFSLQELSPINCSTIILYNFLLPDCKIKSRIIEHLKIKYDHLSLHFHHLKIQNQQDFSALTLKPLVQVSKSKHKISHFVLDFKASLFQLKSLLKQLQIMNIQKCYFRMVVVCEKIETQNMIGGNYFPFSWQTIAYFYSEMYNQHLKLGKLEQRCKKLEQVTHYLHGMKNEQVSRWPDRIEVSMGELEGCTKQLRRSIQQIVQMQYVKMEKYFNLVFELQKSSTTAELDYQEIGQSIISRSYTPIKCLDLQIK